jgi:hypothetical protein
MPPFALPIDSDSDSDAPEVVSRSAARAQAQGRDEARRAFQAEQRDRAKARNRAHDERGKERARERAIRTGARSVDDDSDGKRERLEARMQKAMTDAADESEQDTSQGQVDEMERVKGATLEIGDVEFGGLGDEDTASDDDGGLEDADAAMDREREDEESANPHKPDYLPDHLFAALGQRQKTSDTPATQSKPDDRPRKKARRDKTKDVVLGYAFHLDARTQPLLGFHADHRIHLRTRTVRTLNPTRQSSRPLSLAPLPRLSKFRDRALALKQEPAPAPSNDPFSQQGRNPDVRRKKHSSGTRDNLMWERRPGTQMS